MYRSEYFQEKNVELKDSITGGALTTGIITTVIVLLLQFSICVSMAFPIWGS
jgi:hypothetical protein